jgi:hypothetical protein
MCRICDEELIPTAIKTTEAHTTVRAFVGPALVISVLVLLGTFFGDFQIRFSTWATGCVFSGFFTIVIFRFAYCLYRMKKIRKKVKHDEVEDYVVKNEEFMRAYRKMSE